MKAIIALKVCISSITQLDDSSQCTPCTAVTIMDLQMCRVHVCKAIIALKVCICTAGSYCYNNGLTDVQGTCMQGYYCPEGMYIWHY